MKSKNENAYIQIIEGPASDLLCKSSFSCPIGPKINTNSIPKNLHNLILYWDTILYIKVTDYIPVQAQYHGQIYAHSTSVYYNVLILII